MEDPKETTRHNHEPSEASIEATKAKSAMKISVQSHRVNPGQALATGIQQLSTEAQVVLGSDAAVIRNLRRQRSSGMPRNPRSLRRLVVEGLWTTTGGATPKPFLLYDSGPEDSSRLIAYASEEQLRFLSESDVWFMDGNQAMSPKLFTQLFVIRCPLGESAVTCAYALMNGRTQEQYERFFRSITAAAQNLGIRADPGKVVCDFEMAIMSAVRSHLGEQVRRQGCFFHLCQSTWRRIQELGLATLYHSDEEVRQFCRMLDALAFLPLNQVQEGMAYLRSNAPDIEPIRELVGYFEKNYVTGTARRIPATHDPLSVRFRLTPPLFDPSMWNVHQATLDNDHRTNNICEGWNNGFQNLVGHKKPSVWKIIECIQKDQSKACKSLLRFQRGESTSYRQSQQTISMQKRLRNLCLRVADGHMTLAAFLRAVAHNIIHQPVAREDSVGGGESLDEDEEIDEDSVGGGESLDEDEETDEDAVGVDEEEDEETGNDAVETVTDEAEMGAEEVRNASDNNITQETVRRSRVTRRVRRRLSLSPEAQPISVADIIDLTVNVDAAQSGSESDNVDVDAIQSRSASDNADVDAAQSRSASDSANIVGAEPRGSDTGEQGQRRCPVCLDPDAEITMLLNPCGHCFCENCIQQLLAMPLHNNTDHRCPICRSDIFTTIKMLFAL